ncbi:MAG: peptidylprolyl isomerase [FCB group bacterium]|jgi:peptidyl-prolyl cis-trans isomerase SurA
MQKQFKILFFAFSIIFLFGFVSSQNILAQKKKNVTETKSKDVRNETIATIGKDKITFGEVEKAFKKNINRKEVKLYEISKDSIDDFFNLYLNYRLKVKDALSRGFDKDSSVLADIAQNRKVLAESFFYEKKLINPMVDKWIKLRERELQIAIIMVSFPPNANADTLQSFHKALRFISAIKSGANFEKMALDSSDDKETSKHGGLISTFITAGNVQRPIEDIIYSLKPGEIYSNPIRTRYGYLIIKLLKNEPRLQVLFRHILLVPDKNKDSIAYKKADSLLSLLKHGADFGELAKANSEDKPGASKGGDLGGYYSRTSGFEGTERHLVPELESAAFTLKDGEISNIIKSEYGFHIIKRDSTRDFDQEKEKTDLKILYKKLNFENDKKVFLDSLRNVYGFLLNKNIYNKFLSDLDSSKTNLDSQWTKRVPESLMEQVIFSFNKDQVTINKFIDYMNHRPDLRGLPTNDNGLNRAIDKIVTPMVFDEASKDLEKEFPDFAALINEFKDGILLYKVEALEVWDRLKFDSVQARSYWEPNRTKYKTEPFYDISEIYVLSDSAAKTIYADLKSGKDFDELAKNNTQRKDYREKKGHWGKVSSKDNGLAKIALGKKATEGTILEPVPYEKGFSIIKINKYEPVREKTFEEAIPDFAPEFQDKIQKQLSDYWIESIKTKYKESVNWKEIDKIIAQLKAGK